MARKSKTATETSGATPIPPADAEPVAEAVSSASRIPESARPEPVEATPETTETTAPPPPRVAVRRGGGFGVILGSMVAVVLLSGAAVASWPLWAPRIAALLPVARQDPFADSRMVGIADRLAVVEQRLETSPGGDLVASAGRIDDLAAAQSRLAAEVLTLTARMGDLRGALESLPTDAAGGRDEAAALGARVQTLEQSAQALLGRLNEASARPAGLDAIEARNRELAETVARLTGRVDQMASLEQAEKQAEVRAEAAAAPRLDLAAAVAGLRQALSSSGPFRQELAAVQGALGNGGADSEAVTAVAAHAAQGIPTLAVLRGRFDAVAKDIVRADRMTGGEGWIGRAADRIKGLVTVRRTDGPADPADVDSAVSRAEAALAGDDLRAAVGALEGLQGAPADATRDWLVNARARLAAERALSALDARMARPASAGGGS